jgi:hypothetical protein
MTTATHRFDLRGLIRRVCEESAAADPHTIAKEVSERIDDRDLREALDQALAQVVQNTIATDRRGTFPSDDDAGIPAQRTANQATAPAQGASWKRAGIRRINDELRRKRFAYGFNQNEWKFLADFDRANCQAAAAMRRKLAAGNIREAEKFEWLDELLVQHDAATVYELPEAAKLDVHRRMFSGRSR